MKSVLQITLMCVFLQPYLVKAEPYKCLLVTEIDSEFIQYFDIGTYSETLQAANKISIVRSPGKQFKVKRLVECVPSSQIFSSHSARELDKNSPK